MPARPTFLFAPGAGAPASSGWMRAWRDRLATLGHVTAFDYPYMRAGRKSPDKLPILIEAHRAALAELRAKTKGPLFLIGKSMGGRVGCHLALSEKVAGVICLGYPLKAAASGALRDQVLVDLRTPILFVQGTRDPLCPLDLLATVRPRMTAPNTLVVVEGGDHSLAVSAAVRKERGETQADSDARVLEAIRAFGAF
ncbi:MAG TPA: alpha/beta fold hydrolase [Polyangia bacterium]|nr:alpha/beta fold hydrolase [Polyangia bacterium]